MTDSIFKDNLFDGKKVFITGGATGMGLGFAQAFLNHGAKVIIASRKEDKLEEAAEITKEKFGKKAKIKIIDQKKSFLQKRLSSSINNNDIFNRLEEMIMWSRYGL